MSTIRKKSIALTLTSAALALAVGVMATPALADSGKHHRGGHHGHYGPSGHHKHHHHHGQVRYYPAPGYYYAPPPVYYVPRPAYYYPPPQPGLTIVFPIGGIF